MKPFGVVYLIVNKVNGKMYVGQTTRTLEKRFNEHSKDHFAIGNAIRKYGAENFRCEVLKLCASKAEMDAWEKFFIAAICCKIPFGYNVSDGGGGVAGRKHTDEERAKITVAKKGKHPTKETRAKIAATLTGRYLSSEHIARIAAAQRGEKNNNYGKHPANDTRVKMSRAKRTSPYKNLLNELDARQLTYAALAKILGLTISTVAYKMRGQVRFKERDKAKLEEIFGKPIEYLLARDGD